MDDLRNLGANIDAEEIQRTVHEAMRGLDATLADLGLDQGESSEQHLEVGRGSRLSLTTVGGEVVVRGADSQAIDLRASTAVRVERDGDQISVRPAKGASANFEVEVPRGCGVSVQAVQADVEIRDTRGPVQIQSVSGDVEVAGASGESRIVSSSGDVTGRDLTGALSMRSASGDARIESSHLTEFEVTSSSGDLWIETSLASEGRYSARATSGDVTLALPPDSRAEVVLSTVSGDASCRLPVDVVASSKRQWRGRLNGGGVKVQVQTTSGDLEIVEGAASGAPRRPSEPEPPKSTFRPDAPDASVLKALERGEISVEEAMERLSESEER